MLNVLPCEGSESVYHSTLPDPCPLYSQLSNNVNKLRNITVLWVDGDDLSTSPADQHDTIQALHQNLQELHVWDIVWLKNAHHGVKEWV